MCNKGEMNAQMSEIMKLVADAVINTKAEFIKNPSIYIIMNMLAEIKHTTQQECIAHLEEHLIEQSQDNSGDQKQKQVLKIGKESVFPLDYAFDKFAFGPEG